jgi:CrcB protein
VNVLGCLGVGVLAQLVEVRGAFTPDVRALLIVGFLGGFTTFSAFANETLSGIREGAYATAIANVLANLTLCLIAVWLGRLLAQAIWK